MNINSLESVIEARKRIQSIVSRLQVNGCDGWVEFLSQRTSDMDSWFATKEAFFQIGEVCHPKALGDIQFEDLDWKDWLTEIDELKSACARAFHDLETLGPTCGK